MIENPPLHIVIATGEEFFNIRWAEDRPNSPHQFVTEQGTGIDLIPVLAETMEDYRKRLGIQQ